MELDDKAENKSDDLKGKAEDHDSTRRASVRKADAG
jgi:hypothetical protein